METVTSRITVSLSVIAVIICIAEAIAFPRMGRSNYLAFPRMGRSYLALPRMGRANYLAFPRMGRSQAKAPSPDCCGLGLKSVVVLGDEDHEERAVCTEDVCCPGLGLTVEQGAKRVFYTLCEPQRETSPFSEDNTTEDVLNRYKELLQKLEE